MKKNRFKGLLFKRYLTALGFIFLFSFYGFAQSFSLTGTILDETGEAIIGANVLVKGTTSGTISDFDGAFSLPNVSIGSTIEVSFIGYEGQEITVKEIGRASCRERV